MKTKTYSILILHLSFFMANTFAQIPNSGFENWSLAPNATYIIPDGWQTSRDTVENSFRPASRDESHYPASVGNYSIRLENNPSLIPSYSALAIAETGNIIGAKPAFAITGHPTSLTGYYKYAPLNGDTLWIAVLLTQSGDLVAQGEFLSAASVTNWTSFNIPIGSYTSADSAFIILSAYKATGPGQVPHGNSVLNVDNLNFDNLITTGISEDIGTTNISVYPNPFSSETTLQTNKNLNDATLTIYNSLGQQINQIKNINGRTITLHRDNLPGGLYYVRITQSNKLITSDKLIIQDN